MSGAQEPGDYEFTGQGCEVAATSRATGRPARWKPGHLPWVLLLPQPGSRGSHRAVVVAGAVAGPCVCTCVGEPAFPVLAFGPVPLIAPGTVTLLGSARYAWSIATTDIEAGSPRRWKSQAGTSRMDPSVLYAAVSPSVAPVTTRSGTGAHPGWPATLRHSNAMAVMGWGRASSSS